MATIQETLGLLDETTRELSFYDSGSYKSSQEQSSLSRCKDSLEKVKTNILIKEPDGSLVADKLTSNDWKRMADLVLPLARCFMSPTSTHAGPSAKSRHFSAMALATLMKISSCTPKSRVIATAAIDNGVVDAFVSTLRHSLRNPVTDRVVRATLYMLVDCLLGLTTYASTQQQLALVAKDVVDVALELLTSATVEPESKLLASKTLYNCLITSGRCVTALRTSKVMALSGCLSQLAHQVPDPQAVAAAALAGSYKTISLPVLLPSVLSWIWFLPDYILDHLIGPLAILTRRIVALVWPEGCSGIPLIENPTPTGPTSPDPPASTPDLPSTTANHPPSRTAGPLHVAQLSLPNRSLRTTFQNLLLALTHGTTDPRLVVLLRGTHLPDLALSSATSPTTDAAGCGPHATAPGAPFPPPLGPSTGLPIRLVRVVSEGRPDGMEVRVALELLNEVFSCDEAGHPELADDALGSGLLRAMSELQVFAAMRSELGLTGLSAYVKLVMKLVRRTPFTPGLEQRLRDSGVPASVAYLAFWPQGKFTLKLEALQALHDLVKLGPDMADTVVALPNFPVALINTLLGGDPDTRKPSKKGPGGTSGGASKKKGAAGAGVAAAAAGGGSNSGGVAGAAGANGAGADGGGDLLGGSSRSLRDQIQEAALDILTVMLDVARDSEKVWQTVVESGMLPRLLQHSLTSPMQAALLAEALTALGLTFSDHSAIVASESQHSAGAAAGGGPDPRHHRPATGARGAAGSGEGDGDNCDLVVAMGELQAGCCPYVLPLVGYEDTTVALAAARLLLGILRDMQRYRRRPEDLDQGNDILQALVAAGGAIDQADEVAAVVAAAAAGKGRAGGVGVEVKRELAPDGPQEGGREVDVTMEEVETADGNMKKGAPEGAVGATGGGGEGGGVEVVKVESLSSVESTVKAAGGSGKVSSLKAEGSGHLDGCKPEAPASVASGGGAGVPVSISPAGSPLPRLVDVTAHGLGQLCAALRHWVDVMLQQQPRGPGATAAATTMVPVSPAKLPPTTTPAGTVPSTAGHHGCSPRGAAPAPTATIAIVGGGSLPAAAGWGGTGLAPPLMAGPAAEALSTLLQCVGMLADTALEMGTGGALRRHLARALAYAVPPLEELVAALEGGGTAAAMPGGGGAGGMRPGGTHGVGVLVGEAQRVLVGLRRIPVLDVALLPRPNVVMEEEVKEAPPPAAHGGSRRRKGATAAAPAQADINTDPAPAPAIVAGATTTFTAAGIRVAPSRAVKDNPRRDRHSAVVNELTGPTTLSESEMPRRGRKVNMTETTLFTGAAPPPPGSIPKRGRPLGSGKKRPPQSTLTTAPPTGPAPAPCSASPPQQPEQPPSKRQRMPSALALAAAVDANGDSARSRATPAAAATDPRVGNGWSGSSAPAHKALPPPVATRTSATPAAAAAVPSSSFAAAAAAVAMATANLPSATAAHQRTPHPTVTALGRDGSLPPAAITRSGSGHEAAEGALDAALEVNGRRHNGATSGVTGGRARRGGGGGGDSLGVGGAHGSEDGSSGLTPAQFAHALPPRLPSTEQFIRGGGVGPSPMDSSPSCSLDARSQGAVPVCATEAAVGGAGLCGTAATGGPAAAAGVAGVGGGTSRPRVADFKARFLELRNQNAVLVSELETQRHVAEEATALQRATAASLAASTSEVEALLTEVEAARAEAAAARAEANEARRLAATLQAENARLRQELDELADVDLA